MIQFQRTWRRQLWSQGNKKDSNRAVLRTIPQKRLIHSDKSTPRGVFLCGSNPVRGALKIILFCKVIFCYLMESSNLNRAILLNPLYNLLMEIIPTILILFVVTFSLRYMAKAVANAPAERVEGKKVMRYDKTLTYLGFIGILIPITLLTTYFVGPENQRTTGLLIGEIVFLIIFGGIGLYLILAAKRTRVEFDENTIRLINFLGKSKDLKWSDIKSVTYSKNSMYLCLKTDREKINIHSSMFTGFKLFKEELMSKLPETMYADAFAKLNSVR